MTSHEVTINSGDWQLAGQIYRPLLRYSQVPGVLLLHDYQTDQTTMTDWAQAAAQAGSIAMTFDLSGHGHSHGDIKRSTYYDHLIDSEAAYSVLADESYLNNRRIGILGIGYGAALAAGLSLVGRPPVKSILLRRPILLRESQTKLPLTYEEIDLAAQIEQPRINWDNATLNAIKLFGRAVLLAYTPGELRAYENSIKAIRSSISQWQAERISPDNSNGRDFKAIIATWVKVELQSQSISEADLEKD